MDQVKSNNNARLFYIFLGGWTLINILQSIFTGLFNDEALYWAFSQRPDLGYFDHPPLTAWCIWMTSWIPGELGVRLPFILMSSGTIYFLWKILQPSDLRLFAFLLLGVPLFHVGGFFAAPDVPLLFLMTCFLWAYQSYFYQDSMLKAIWLGLLLGGMGLAKYHAILFALALVLSNTDLFKRKSFYLLVGMATLVILPHLWWQFQNDWVSLQFHLFSRRGAKPWSWSFVGDYIGGQIGIYGIFLAFLLWAASFKRQPNDHYDCIHKYTFFTVFIFFTLSVFRGRVEANWTAMAIVPMIYLTYQYIEERKNWKKWTFIFSGFSLAIVMALRVILAFEVLPPNLNPRNETHGYSEWAREIQQAAEGDPVIFINNYRKPAKYTFYTGETSTSWNMSEYSGNQYDLWTQDEIALQGQSVFVVSNEQTGRDSLHFDHGIQSECVHHVSPWYSYNFIDITAEMISEGRASATVDVQLHFENKTAFAPLKGQGSVQLVAGFYQYEKLMHQHILSNEFEIESLVPSSTNTSSFSVRLPEMEGEFVVKFGFVTQGLIGLNSPPYFIHIL